MTALELKTALDNQILALLEWNSALRVRSSTFPFPNNG